MTVPRPVRVAIVNDYEIIVAGTAQMLADFCDRVQITELDRQLAPFTAVDVILYDTFGSVQGDGSVDLASLVEACGDARVVVFTWATDADLAERAIAAGASGFVSKALAPADVVKALEDVHAGVIVIAIPPGSPEAASQDALTRVLDLSPRETEVLALIAKGLSNKEIGETLFLSINSIKTYIRTAYAKIGVHSRSQAVLWSMSNGLAPTKGRTILTRDGNGRP